MTQVELDIELIEEIPAQNHVEVLAEVSLTRHHELQILASDPADAELIDDGSLRLSLATDAEYAKTPRLLPGEAQALRRRTHDQADTRSGIQHDTDLLAVDGAVYDWHAASRPNRPIRDLEHLAVGRRGETGR